MSVITPNPLANAISSLDVVSLLRTTLSERGLLSDNIVVLTIMLFSFYLSQNDKYCR